MKLKKQNVIQRINEFQNICLYETGNVAVSVCYKFRCLMVYQQAWDHNLKSGKLETFKYVLNECPLHSAKARHVEKKFPKVWSRCSSWHQGVILFYKFQFITIWCKHSKLIIYLC